MSEDKPKIVTVEVSEEEYKDLEEFSEHHPDVKSPGEALKMMAGLRTYRTMKEKLDKERKKPSEMALLPQDLEIPTWVPCALGDQLRTFGMTYEEYIQRAVEDAVKWLEKALTGDKEAEEELKKMMERIGFRRLGPYQVKVV